MSVLDRADAWNNVAVSLDENEDESTPLNSREPSPAKQQSRGVSSAASALTRARVQPAGALAREASPLEMTAAAAAAHDTGRMGVDLRKSRMSYLLIVLFLATMALDGLLLLQVLNEVELIGESSVF